MDERRAFVRLETRVDVSYTVLPSGLAQHTITKDISGGGIRFVTERPLPTGTQLQLAVKLPDREEPVNAIAEVVWSEASETIGQGDRQQSVEVGARSVEIAPKDQEALTSRVSRMKSS